jgi:hypothetical protein
MDDEIPDHSVLSKARARWGKEVFESLFVRTIGQCVEAGLVDGRKLHVDSSLIDADAARGSVIKGAPELITALPRAYHATESKLSDATTADSYDAVIATTVDVILANDPGCTPSPSADSRIFPRGTLRGNPGDVFPTPS